MRSLTLLLALEASAVAAQKVVSWNVQRPKRQPLTEERVKAKRATITEAIGNGEELYYANVTVGTPGQLLQLQLDTGSSDVWMTATGASYCQQNQAQGGCVGGTFSTSQSSTYQLVSQGTFNISYVDGTGSTGNYFTDNINIGGVTIDAQQMGLATQTTIGTGIMGVGFANDESVCKTVQCPNQYPSIIETMVNQSKINTQAYSLWLDDLSDATGSILFGGVDSSKYSGPLVALPILPDSQSGGITSFTVAWTGFAMGTPKGEMTQFAGSNFEEAAILDSGTSDLLFPDSIAAQLITQFGATYSQSLQSYVAPCYLRTANATLDFQFGGSSGPTIHVPVAEFLLDLGTNSNGQPFTFSNGDVACQLGFEAAQGRPILLGDTFLRSAYVVYDLTGQQIAIAQANFNGGKSNVQEIQSGTAGIPGVSSTATGGASASNGATGAETATAAATGGIFGGHGGSATAGIMGSNGAPPLAAYTTAKYTGQGSVPGSGSVSTSSGAASGITVPASNFEGLAVFGLMSVFAFIGSGLILL